jgi:predicted amidohydrolase YtcJ
MAAETIQTFINGKVFTARNEAEFVSAFRIGDGKITGIGKSSAVNGGDTIDLKGRTVLPGFIDAHTHPPLVAMTIRAVPCTAPFVNNIPGMITALKQHPNYGKGDTEWIEGWGYDESRLAEHRTPTTRDLDKVSTTQPVYVLRSDCHSGICNTRALRLAGITRDTPDPPAARFGRYENGEPNGVLQEFAAKDAVLRAKTVPGYPAKVREIAATGAHYNERGIVAVSDMLASTTPFNDLQLYRDAEKQGLKQQAPLYFEWTALKRNMIPDLTNDQRTGRMKFAGLKLFADGSISNRTAWVNEPYRNSDERGVSLLPKDDLAGACEWASRNRIQLAIHAMGDNAIQNVIDFFAGEAPWMASGIPSVRLEHISLLSEAQAQQMKDSKMLFGATTQIIFLFAEYDSYSANLRDRQLRCVYPVKMFYRNIDRLAMSSDAPATTWADPDDVFVSLKAAVTRKAYNSANIGPEQAITLPQAILLYTAKAATVAPYDGLLGQIAPGFEASFVVLDRDIFTIKPDDIDKAVVVETWIAGEKVFERS